MSNRFRSFEDMGSRAYGRPSFEERKKMQSQRIDSPLVEATCKYFNYNNGYGFLYVKIPQGTVLPYSITTADIDDQPGTRWSKGEELERPVTVEAFIHETALVKANYRSNIAVGDEVKVRLKEDTVKNRGLQAFWVVPIDGGEVTPRESSNERRISNAFLPFVPGTIKTFDQLKGFGFVSTCFDCETGNLLPEDQIVDVYFKADVLGRAGLNVSPGSEVAFRYWKYSNGDMRVAQFKYAEK